MKGCKMKALARRNIMGDIRGEKGKWLLLLAMVFCCAGNVWAGTAELILSENEETYTFEGDHNINDVVTLPNAVHAENEIEGKVLVGWTDEANKNYSHASEQPSVFYAKGANFTLTEATQTLYAVYATETPEVNVTHKLTISGKSFVGYGNRSDVDDKGATWSGVYGYYDATHISLTYNEDDHYYLASPVFAANIASVKAKITNTSNKSWAYLSPRQGTVNVLENVGYATVAKGSLDAEITFSMLSSTSKRFYIFVSGALYFNEIEVTCYQAATYSDYLTKTEKGSATGIEETKSGERGVKMLRDGQLLIVRDEKIYNAQGQRAE